MAKEGLWRPLRLESDGLPQLIVKAHFEDAGYHIQLSDLSRVWEEKLSKKAIINRASDEGCSIDAIEDDQYSILLDKINSAFNRQTGTTLDLRQSASKQDLELDVTAPLPASLPTLRWTVHLSKLPTQAIEVDVVTPLLHQAKNLHGQIEQLVKQLHVKDHVITKVTERLEKTGNDLSQVWPATSDVKTNRRSSQREQLASRIAGLGEFNENIWRASLVQDVEVQRFSSEALNELLKDVESDQPHNAYTLDWWEKLNSGHAVRRGKGHRQPHANNGSHSHAAASAIEEERFAHKSQHQETPSNARSRESTPSTKDGEIDGETPAERPWLNYGGASNDEKRTQDDDEDLKDSATTKRASIPLSPPQAKQNLRLGAFGSCKGKSKSPQSVAAREDPSNEPDPPAEPRSTLGKFGGRREVTPSTTEIIAAPDQETKAKLGKFGSPAKTTRSQIEQESEQSGSSPISKQRLGMFHGKNGGQSSAVPEAEAQRSSKPVGTQGSPSHSTNQREPPERTMGATEGTQMKRDAEEPPHEKRERLKRELEDKSRAPTRKKRKF